MAGHYTTKPQQHADELTEFIAFLKGKQITSFLEIGSKFGGALWAIAQQALAPKSRIVSVDLPNSRWGRSDSERSLRDCITELKRQGHDAHLLIGDSTAASIVSQVKALAPFDAIFIDANHTEPFVRKDFANYGQLSKIVCFHDIGWNNPTPPGRLTIEVPKVWRELKEAHKDQATFLEIKRDTNHNGIGVLQWH
jgi:predicted O-methyltransferase YrrM